MLQAIFKFFKNKYKLHNNTKYYIYNFFKNLYNNKLYICKLNIYNLSRLININN